MSYRVQFKAKGKVYKSQIVGNKSYAEALADYFKKAGHRDIRIRRLR
jgi:hypothetical protein